jgi:hypothetical protein
LLAEIVLDGLDVDQAHGSRAVERREIVLDLEPLLFANLQRRHECPDIWCRGDGRRIARQLAFDATEIRFERPTRRLYSFGGRAQLGECILDRPDNDLGIEHVVSQLLSDRFVGEIHRKREVVRADRRAPVIKASADVVEKPLPTVAATADGH